MHVFHVATECASVISVGGLGDVVFQIGKQCALAGIDTTIILPKYGRLDRDFESQFGREVKSKIEEASDVPVRLSFPGKADPTADPDERVRFAEVLVPTSIAPIRLCFVHSPRFERRMEAYGRPSYPDVCPINLLLQKAALVYIRDRTSPGDQVIVHGHDAHVGTLPLIARRSPQFRSHLSSFNYVSTGHNCGWGLRQRLWMADFEKEINFLTHALDVSRADVLNCIMNDGERNVPGFEPFLAAVLFGDHFTLVSEGYCWEILQGGNSPTAECDAEVLAFSRSLEERRRSKELRSSISGITNGIDPEEVGPEALPKAVRSPLITTADFGWKQQFKHGLLDRLKSGSSQRPDYWSEINDIDGSLDLLSPHECVLFTYVGRLDRQKGLDILARAVEEVFPYRERAGLCLLGGGELAELRHIAARFPGRVVILNGRSENVAKEIYAAGDFFLIPSRFEPCGLIDFRAQLNGNIPIANQVGGLSKIIHGKTGIGFFGLGDRFILRGLVEAMHHAVDLYANKPALSAMTLEANAWVRRNHTWDKVFPAFYELYGAGPRPRH